MIHPPHWLTNQAVDLISVGDYEILREEFMMAFAEEEMARIKKCFEKVIPDLPAQVTAWLDPTTSGESTDPFPAVHKCLAS
jgi:hypothetical protein